MPNVRLAASVRVDERLGIGHKALCLMSARFMPDVSTTKRLWAFGASKFSRLHHSPCLELSTSSVHVHTQSAERQRQTYLPRTTT